MTRLPQPGGDDGTWGNILNDFLSQAHNADGSLKPLSESQITNLAADLAAKLSKWQANTSYHTNDYVLSPSGQIIQASTDFTSGSMYNASNWSVISAVVGDTASAGVSATSALLKSWTASGAYQLLAITYDPTYSTVISTATVLWPDGSAGTYTTDMINTTFAAVDAYQITHSASGKTITQAAVTRNTDGSITARPALTVA